MPASGRRGPHAHARDTGRRISPPLDEFATTVIFRRAAPLPGFAGFTAFAGLFRGSTRAKNELNVVYHRKLVFLNCVAA
jgi:hypothetical protein